MFDHIVLRRAEHGTPISIGQIAEALFYYQRVHLIVDRGTLEYLIRQIGCVGVLRLLRRHELSAVYCEEMLGTHTESFGVSQRHNFLAFTLTGNRDVGPLDSAAKRLRFDLERLNIGQAEAKRFVKFFLDHVPVRRLSGDYYVKGGIPQAAKRDVSDVEYLRSAIACAVETTEGGYPTGEDFNLEVVDTESGFFVFTNIDLKRINTNRSRAIPAVDTITIAHLLSEVLNARADIALASFYGGDFVTSNTTSSIIKRRYEALFRRANLNIESKQRFSEIVLPDTPSLAEVIDAKERSIDEFFVLLDQAGRFKEWLKKVNPDENLVRTYMRDISSRAWIERLPAKSVRYVITLALDATNPLAGLTSGLFDNFLVEKIFSGWRPNHFVSKRLAPFLQDIKPRL